MIVRELLTVLGFDLDDAGFKKSEGAFKTLLGFSAAVVAGATAAAGALLYVARSTANAGDEARDAARETGLSVEGYQELTYAAKQSGVEVGTLTTALRASQIRASAVVAGNKEAASAFRAVGVNVRGANGELKSGEQILSETADGLLGIENQTQRAAAAASIFGARIGTRMLPLLLEGSKGIDAMRARARELGFILSKEDADAADTFNDSVTDLSLALEGIKRRLGVALIPTLIKVINVTTDWILVNKDLIDPILKGVAHAMIVVVEAGLSLVRTIQDNARFLKVLGLVIVGMLTPALIALAGAWIAVHSAQLLALAIPVLMVAGFLLLASVIALVIEDVYVFVTGGKSLIGELIAAFVEAPEDPNAHWLVKILRFVLTAIRDAIVATNQFFKGFFDSALELGGVTEALKNMFSTAVDFWWEKLKTFAGDAAKLIMKIPSGIFQFVPGLAPLQAFQSGGALATGSSPAQFPAFGGAASGLNGAQSAPVQLQTGNTTIQVDARGAADPAKVGREVGREVDRSNANHRRELHRQVKSQVVR